jgi:hypothetical protein
MSNKKANKAQPKQKRVVKVKTKQNAYKGQTKKMSLTEAILNVAVGYTIAVLTQYAVFPLFGIHIGLSEHLSIASLFTVVSIARSYFLRRFFNWIDLKGLKTNVKHRKNTKKSR